MIVENVYAPFLLHINQLNYHEAVESVYASYLRAEPFMEYEALDAVKRSPILLQEQMNQVMLTSPTILITGSKGKGAVAKVLASLLSYDGSCGLVTSPHVHSFTERIQVNQQSITEEEFVTEMKRLLPVLFQIQSTLISAQYISPVGIEVCLAQQHFWKNQTRYQIFECGKGVQYDDTNCLFHQYAIITPIFLEHKRELGDTIEQIAVDKSHILTQDVKVAVSAAQSEKVLDLLQRQAKRQQVMLLIEGKDFFCENIHTSFSGTMFDFRYQNFKIEQIHIPMLGEHQAKNTSLALMMYLHLMQERLQEPEKLCLITAQGLSERISSISYPGRMQVLSRHPLMILDACIHRNSAILVKKVLQQMTTELFITVLCIPIDKDDCGVTKEIAEISEQIIFTQVPNPHYHFEANQLHRISKMLFCENSSSEKVQPDADQKELIWREEPYEAIQFALHVSEKSKKPILLLGTTAFVEWVLKDNWGK